jgi:CBS domain-containing protein
MRVSDLMQGDVRTVPPDAVVQDAAALLADSHISALPVVDGIGRMVGVISRTDILASEEEAEDKAARQTLFEGTFVRDLMTSPALTIAPEVDVKEAAQQMLYTGVHRLFVTTDDRVVGVISTTDIVRAVAMGRL